MYDLLIIDDIETWQKIVVEAFRGIYECKVATLYEDALRAINAGGYKAICINWNFHSINNGRKILTLLNKKYPEIPVILITGNLEGRASKIQSSYLNVKEVLLKGSEVVEDSDFIEDLLDTVPKYLSGFPGYGFSSIKLSWLHLSDIHCGCNERDKDWEALKDALIKDVQAHKKSPSEQTGQYAGVIFSPNLILITGDVAYHGLESEYDLAEQFLQELWNATGLGKEQTFVVPGNHDVDRSSVQNDLMFTAVYERLRNEENTQRWFEELEGFWTHPYLRDRWSEKFSTYFNFINKCSNVTHELGCFVKTINISGNVVDIMGVNSAIMSWKDGEDKERGLWIGKPQLDELEKALSKNPALRISLVHHPNDSFHYEDIAWSRLQELSNIVFHGHLHKPRVVINGEPEREHICLPGGSIQDKGIWSRQRYSYGEFDLKTRQLNLYLRMTNNSTPYPEYIRDNQTYHRAAPDGHLTIFLPAK